jgi:hypothetical protein
MIEDRRVTIAKRAQAEIAQLDKEREKIYRKTLRRLRIADTSAAFDYFYANQCGISAFEESLRRLP